MRARSEHAGAHAGPRDEPARRHERSAARARAAAWLAATRPRTLPAAVVPVVVGLALAGRERRLDALVACVTLVTAVLIQVGTNLVNDYYDFVAGADTADRLGPRRLAQAGIVEPRTVRRAAYAVLGLAALAGVYLVGVGGWPIAAIGVPSLVAAVAYTAGPWPLAYHGLGEPFVFAFFGPIAVHGTVLLQGGTASLASALASLPVGCLATAILVVNNLRDIPTDARAGKATLAVRIGAAATRRAYVGLVAAAFLAVMVLGAADDAAALVALAALPLALHEGAAVVRRSGAALNRSLAGTARLHLVFGLLLALGLVL